MNWRFEKMSWGELLEELNNLPIADHQNIFDVINVEETKEKEILINGEFYEDE